MQCPKCRYENTEDAVSCNLCGASFKNDPIPPTSSISPLISVPDSRWQIPHPGFAGLWLGFYLLITLNQTILHMFSLVNLPIHEWGHLIFGWGGRFIGLIGGTVLQLTFPVIAIVTFWLRGHLNGLVFGLFWLGVNFIGIGVYMADANAMKLPLYTVGSSDKPTLHDWFHIFQSLGLLNYDTVIGGAVQALGWVCMIIAPGALVVISLLNKYRPAFLFSDKKKD